MNIEIRIIPEHFAYTAEYDIDSYSDFFNLETGGNDLMDLEELMHEENPEVVVPDIPDDYNYFTHPAGTVPDGTMHTSYFDMVDRPGRDNSEGKYRFVHVPEIKAAVVPWQGPHSSVPEGISVVLGMLEDEGLEIAGDTRVSAIHGPWDKEDEEEYLVEIQIPVK